MGYRIEVIPNKAADAKEYWTAKFPAVPACVGCGTTPEEAICEARENLAVYLEYLAEEGYPAPAEEDTQTDYSGKIALRIPKSTHRKVAEYARREGISINLVLNNAIEHYFGLKEYEYNLDSKISEIRELTESSIDLQQINVMYSQKIWERGEYQTTLAGEYHE